MDTVSGPVDILAERSLIGLDQVELHLAHGAPDQQHEAHIADKRRLGQPAHAMHPDARRRRSPNPVAGEEMNFGPFRRQSIHDGLGEALGPPERVIPVSNECDFQKCFQRSSESI